MIPGNRLRTAPQAPAGARAAGSRAPAPHPRYLVPRGGADLVVSCVVYVDGRSTTAMVDPDDLDALLQQAEAKGGFVWLGLWEPTEDEFAEVATRLELPGLAVEDAICAHQRPKLEGYGPDLAFAVIKPVHYIDQTETIETAEMAVFVGRHFVVTVRHGRSDIPSQARARLEADPERLASGPGAVLHELMDLTVDGYLAVLDAIETDIDDIEEQVFGGDETDHSRRIYLLKREVLEFRRAAAPLVAPLAQLTENHVHIGLPESQRLLFRDVHGHTLRVAEALDSFNHLLTDVLQAELAQVSVRQNRVAARQNEDMRKISAWAAIGLVPTIFGAIYGMNFENMPELHLRYGYFVVLALTGVICVSLYALFRRNHWL